MLFFLLTKSINIKRYKFKSTFILKSHGMANENPSYNVEQDVKTFFIDSENVNQEFVDYLNTKDDGEIFYEQDGLNIRSETLKTNNNVFVWDFDGINNCRQESVPKQNQKQEQTIYKEKEEFEGEEKREKTQNLSHHYSYSTDDLQRSGCISCTLCEANSNVTRSRDGGFPLRKVASCSICTWDIEEREISSSSDEEESGVSESSVGEETHSSSMYQICDNLESITFSEVNVNCLPNTIIHNADPKTIITDLTVLPKRRNSYTQAIGEERDFIKSLNVNYDLESQPLIITRSPPDGGEEVLLQEEILSQKQIQTEGEEDNPKSNKKSKKLKVQTSLDRKVAKELDDIFGKIKGTPNASFDDFEEDDFESSLNISSIPRKSKKGSFKKIIRTPSFLKKKKSNLDHFRSRSVEQLYTNSYIGSNSPKENSGIKKTMSTLEVSSSYFMDCDEDMSVNEQHIHNVWINHLTSIGGTAVFGGNENLRYIWHQISSYQNDLVQPFDDFLKCILEDMQRAFKKCQDLEAALLLKTQQQEKETSKIYDDAELVMKQEREQLQEKHIEKEEQIRKDYTKLIANKNQEIQELTKINTEITEREKSVTQHNQRMKETVESLEVQSTIFLQNENFSKEQINKLSQENKMLLSSLSERDETIRELQEQLIQVMRETSLTKDDYESCLKKFKDIVEEREYLEVNISNLTSELKELKNRSIHSLDKSCNSISSSEHLYKNDEGIMSHKSTCSIHHQPNVDLFDCKHNKYKHINHSQTTITRKETPSASTPVKRPNNLEFSEVVKPLNSIENRNKYHPDTCKPNGGNMSTNSLSNSNGEKTPIRFASLIKNEFKVIFAGDTNVGKTSLIRRICYGRFRERRDVTQQPDCSTKLIDCNEKTVTLKLWDTVGQERYDSIPPSYFRKSDVVILVYDIEHEESFLNVKKWLKMVHENTDENIFLVLLANKCDLHHKRSVSAVKGKVLASKNDAMFLEISAKSGENIDKLCAMIVSTLLERDDTVIIRNNFERSLCNISYSFKRKNDVSICCQ